MRVVLALAGVAAAVALSGPASAQTKSVPIDTSAYVIKPVDTTTSILGGTARYLSRVTAGMIDNNGIVRTVNNLMGKRKEGPPVAMQGGLSPLPHPSMYPSNYYKSPLQPVMPQYQTVPRR